MSGQELHFSERSNSQLNARTAQLDASDALLDDAAPLGKLCGVGAEWSGRQYERHFLHATCQFLPLSL